MKLIFVCFATISKNISNMLKFCKFFIWLFLNQHGCPSVGEGTGLKILRFDDESSILIRISRLLPFRGGNKIGDAEPVRMEDDSVDAHSDLIYTPKGK